MKNLKVEMTAGGKSLAEVKTQGGIFQRNVLSPLLFVIAIMPINHLLRKCTGEYKLSKSRETINYPFYMDDIKLFAKNEKELETLIYVVMIGGQDIGMEFGIERCVIQIIRSSKLHITGGIYLSNQEKIRMFREKETYKYLGILEADTIKQRERKEKI